MENEVLICTRDLCKHFVSEHGEQHIISHLNLDIYKKDFTVIMGASGSGKSTILYQLSGLDTPTSASLFFYPLQKQWYIISRKTVSHCRKAYVIIEAVCNHAPRVSFFG